MSGKRHKGDLEYRLSQYLDGQLPADDAEAMEKRLHEDPALREELRRYRRLESHLSRMRAELAGDDCRRQRASIMAAVERQALLVGPPRRAWRLRGGLWGGLAAAAVALIAATVALLVLERGPTPLPSDVRVTVRPAAPEVANGGEVIVLSRHLDVTELPLALEAEQGSGADLPSGTVVVSVGPPPRGAARPAGLYPIDL
jgi:anti-sigma factor RsiW